MNIILIIISFILVLYFIYYLLRKNWAIKKVNSIGKEEKILYINAALYPFGFEFDQNQDIVISKNDSWQRDLGYHDLYDIKAPFLNMIMDAEPIYFDYNNKHYRIEFWKGQYGITTGAEIGIYIRDFDSDMPNNYYRCANDSERLEMFFLLYKNCFLFSRKKLSWWLTGFEVGKFSYPQDLKLVTGITFPNEEMKNAFITGLYNAGYTENKISNYNNTIYFEYCCPHNYKLNNKHKIIKVFAQKMNKFNCSVYMHLTKHFNTTLDKLTYIRFMFPLLYNIIINLSIPRKKQKNYRK